MFIKRIQGIRAPDVSLSGEKSGWSGRGEKKGSRDA